MTVATFSLCAPDGQKTCFACCPPIRPAGYEHIRHKHIIQRMLRENSLCFNKEDRGLLPITGFSCWALGYLDKDYRRIGCLLHPVQNKGIDLRYRVDYGEKCARESCPESKTFSCLDQDSKRFWLTLAGGLDSFSYSSKKENPLFFMLRWGPDLLRLIASVESHGRCKKEAFFEEYPFFQPCDSAGAPVYLAKCVIKSENVHLLKNVGFREEFERFSSSLSSKLGEALEQAAPFPAGPSTRSPVAVSRGLLGNGLLLPPPLPPPTKGGVRDGGGKEGVKEIAVPPLVARNDRGRLMADSGDGEALQRGHPVHRLPLDRDFLDYLRLFAKIERTTLEHALRLKTLADREIDRFRRSLTAS